MLFKLLSYSLLFLNFRWFILFAQPASALDVSPLVRWCQGMCHFSQSHNPTLLSTFLRRRIHLRSWSQYLREKTCQSHNHDDDHEDDEEEGNEDEDKDDEDYTPLSDSEKEKVYHDADEIKTIRNEAPIPIGKLRDLLNRIDITTLPEFRIKRVPRSG
jgi:hypothetical protein